jgi:hypothetical protein
MMANWILHQKVRSFKVFIHGAKLYPTLENCSQGGGSSRFPHLLVDMEYHQSCLFLQNDGVSWSLNAHFPMWGEVRSFQALRCDDLEMIRRSKPQKRILEEVRSVGSRCSPLGTKPPTQQCSWLLGTQARGATAGVNSQCQAGLTPGQTYRYAARPPRWSPGKRWHLHGKEQKDQWAISMSSTHQPD